MEMLQLCYFTFCSLTHFATGGMSSVWSNVKRPLPARGPNSWFQLMAVFLEAVEAVEVGVTAGR